MALPRHAYPAESPRPVQQVYGTSTLQLAQDFPVPLCAPRYERLVFGAEVS